MPGLVTIMPAMEPAGASAAVAVAQLDGVAHPCGDAAIDTVAEVYPTPGFVTLTAVTEPPVPPMTATAVAPVPSPLIVTAGAVV